MAVGDRLAVLRKGVVEQIGTSDDLYSYPENAFVSNFIGKMNFFSSHVSEVGDDYIMVSVDSTDMMLSVPIQRCHVNPSKGDAVLLGGRPEQLSVSKTASSDSVKGKVRIIQHLGSFIRYEVELDPRISDVTFEIDMDFLDKAIKEGDDVYVGMKKEKMSLFSPEGREI